VPKVEHLPDYIVEGDGLAAAPPVPHDMDGIGSDTMHVALLCDLSGR
jgi:hypothetical protein